MITGIGTDIVEVKRFALTTERLKEVAVSMLGVDELIAFEKAPLQQAYLAKRFAAKEAFIKATGTNAPLSTIQVLNNSEGAPYIDCSYYHQPKTHLSISDEKDYAVAFVIVEE